MNLVVPNHVAIILDGNRRWAKSRGLRPFDGHKKGFDNLVDLSEYIFNKGVKVLSVFAFSTENFKRTKEEVDYLMDLFVRGFKKYFKKLKNKNIKIIIDLKPALTEEKLTQRIQRDFDKNTKKQFKNSLSELLPSKMIPEIVKLSRINPEKKVDDITKEEREMLVKCLKQFVVTIKKFRPIDEAIITAGGVSTKEINPQTMESKIISGLYFAGEIIDVDAYTGGFNLLSAFSTGYDA